MKPLFGPFYAWGCTVVSIFAVIILSAIGILFQTNSESMVGSIHDPENGKEVAKTIFTAVFVYGFFILFCSGQIFLNRRTQSVRL